MRDKNKPDGLKKRQASIDGIVPRAELGVPAHRSYQPSRNDVTPTLGSSGVRTDGFHPNRQSPGGLGATAAEAAERDTVLDEPIVLDDMDYDKRKRKIHGKIHRSKGRRIFKRLAMALLILIVATAAFMGYKFYYTQKKVLSGGGHAPAVCDGNVSTDELVREGDGRVNILLLGIGSEGLLTDTILIASVDPFTNKVDLLSIPRDLWVNIPGNGRDKINAVYEYGQRAPSAKTNFQKQQAGVEALDKTLENITGVTIHYHAVFDFAAFKQIVNALGGVTVNVPETLYDPTIAWENAYNPVIATKGVQHFSGAQALLYAKSRETSSDFARAERQRLLLVAMKDKALSVGTFSNPVKIVQLMNSLGKNVYSDFDTTSIKCLYREVAKVSANNIKSLDLVTPPHDLVTTGNIFGRSIVQPKAGLFNYGPMQDFIRSSFRDGLLARENAPVAIYNATNTPGLATAKAAKLKTLGYNVTVKANASGTNSSTIVVDLTHGKNKYTRHYLENRFGVSATGKLPSNLGITPPQGTAFVIILGTDAAVSN